MEFKSWLEEMSVGPAMGNMFNKQNALIPPDILRAVQTAASSGQKIGDVVKKLVGQKIKNPNMTPEELANLAKLNDRLNSGRFPNSPNNPMGRPK